MKVNVSDAISATVSCMNDGVFVNYVAFPAVPRGHEILRISICACHEIADIERLCTAVAKVKQEK